MSERVLERKLRNVLDLRTDSPAMVDSLLAINNLLLDQQRQQQSSAARSGNSSGSSSAMEARRSLREDLDKQNHRLAASFLASYSTLKERFDGLDAHISDLEKGCKSITDRLSAADSNMSTFTNRVETLSQRRQDLNSKGEHVALFLDKFQLSQQERAALQTPIGSEGGKAFFAALQRLKAIREECLSLVGSKHQAAGFELLEELSQSLEKAYEVLFEWVQDKCKALEEETPEADATLQVVMRALRDRPRFYSHCQEGIVSRRKKLVVQRFMVALTQGANNIRPIEIQAHDPVRYVGDMLAWVHQAAAVEREVLAAVFGGGAPAPAPPASSGAIEEEGAAAEAEAAAAAELVSAGDMLGQVLKGLAPLLQGRVLSVVEESGDFVVGYTLVNYLAFYAKTIAQLFPAADAADADAAAAVSSTAAAGRANALMEALQACHVAAAKKLADSIAAYGQRLLLSPAAYSSDLLPPAAVKEGCKKLSDVLRIHAASFVVDGDEIGQDVNALLKALIEPILESCSLSAEGLGPSDSAVYMLNNIGAVRNALAPFAGAGQGWAERLKDGDTAAWVQNLVENQTAKILDNCGLSIVLDGLAGVDGGQVASLVPGLDAESISQAVTSFYSHIFSLSMPEFERLVDPAVKSLARKGTAMAISDAHAAVYKAVLDPTNEYGDAAFMRHTPEQVSMLVEE